MGNSRRNRWQPICVMRVDRGTQASAVLRRRAYHRRAMTGTIALPGGGPFTANDDLDRRLLARRRCRPGRRAADRRRVRGAGDADRGGDDVGRTARRRGRGADGAAAPRRRGRRGRRRGARRPGRLPRRRLVDAPAQRAQGHRRCSPRSASVLARGGLVAAVGSSAAALCDPMLDQRGGAFTLGLGLVAWRVDRSPRPSRGATSGASARCRWPTRRSSNCRPARPLRPATPAGWELVGDATVHGEPSDA